MQPVPLWFPMKHGDFDDTVTQLEGRIVPRQPSLLRHRWVMQEGMTGAKPNAQQLSGYFAACV